MLAFIIIVAVACVVYAAVSLWRREADDDYPGDEW